MNESNVTQELAPQPETDTGPKIDSIVIWILGGVLMIYTGYHSYNILSKSVSEKATIVALVGLFGLEFGLISWALAYAKGATTGTQKMLAKTFIAIDALGVLVSSLVDSLLHSSSGDTYASFEPIVMFFIPIIIAGNAFAALAYKLNDEKVVEDRKVRDRTYQRRQRLAIQDDLIQREKDDLEYATQWNLYRQQMMDLQENLARVKVALDAREQANRQILSSGKHVEKAAQAMGYGEQGQAKPRENLLDKMPKINIPDWMNFGKQQDQTTTEPNPTQAKISELEAQLQAEQEKSIQLMVATLAKQYPEASPEELESAIRSGNIDQFLNPTEAGEIPAA